MLAREAAVQDRRSGSSPPVVALQLGRVLHLDGRRLGLLGSTMLQVSCSCGHSGQVPVAELVSRHGSAARVRDVVASMRCRSCGEQRIQEVFWRC